jgi:glycerophosphoryl diester phosphodiesterase
MKRAHITTSIFLTLILTLPFTGCRRQETVTDFTFEESLSLLYDEQSPKVLITAHRARHTKYPENSLAAIRHSIESGVDIIEIDVRTTRDGRMVLMHDSDIERTTNGQGKVKEMTWAELQQYRLKGSGSGADTCRIPLLEEALRLAHGKIMVDLDMKGVSVKSLVEMVKKTGTASQVLFFDADFGVLDSVLLLDSTLLIMPRAHDTTELRQIIERYDAEVIHIDDRFFIPQVVAAIKNDGARVWINALGKPDIMAVAGVMKGYQKLAEGGAGIIQTDRPVLLNEYLTKTGRR